jgi:hypothetical protein
MVAIVSFFFLSQKLFLEMAGIWKPGWRISTSHLSLLCLASKAQHLHGGLPWVELTARIGKSIPCRVLLYQPNQLDHAN